MLNTFGRYVIAKKIGKGGMGEVYLAQDPSLNRKIALKVITSTDHEALERFLIEAQTVAQLKHPNIVQVYETGEVGKQHYMAMDYIDGTSLERIIGLKYGTVEADPTTIHKTSTEAKMDPLVKVLDIQSIVRIIIQVAQALEYAHSKKLVHRDIKPANILLDKLGAVFLTDFGIAKQMSGLKQSLTVTGTTIGTPEYMSPEQAMGKKDELDQRSDIFSLGATLYRSITGKLPFEGQEVYDVFTKVIHQEPVLPSRIIRKIPKDLETICLKCLDKDRFKRYQTAKELADDLGRFIEGEPVMARRTGYVTKLWRKARKNKAAAIGIASAAAALIGAVIWLIAAALTTRETVRVYWQEAQELYQDGKYDDARAICEKILEVAPHNVATDELREQCITQIRQQQKNIKTIEDKSRLREKAKVTLDRATGAANPDDKIRIAQDALKIDPTYGDACQTMGYAYADKARREKDPKLYRQLVDKAYESFSKAVDISPHLAYSYYERAMIAAYVYDKSRDAMPDFEKVLKYDPESHIGYFARGNIEADQGKYNEALASYSQAIKVYPKFAHAYTNRGLIYKTRGELDKALNDYNRAIELDTGYAAPYNNRGAIYRLKGENDRAIADFAEVVRLRPGEAAGYLNRGAAYNNQANKITASAGAVYKELLDKAMADYNKAIELDPKRPETYYNRALLYAGKNQFRLAGVNAEQYLRLAPEGPLAKELRLRILEWRSKEEK